MIIVIVAVKWSSNDVLAIFLTIDKIIEKVNLTIITQFAYISTTFENIGSFKRSIRMSLFKNGS